MSQKLSNCVKYSWKNFFSHNQLAFELKYKNQTDIKIDTLEPSIAAIAVTINAIAIIKCIPCTFVALRFIHSFIFYFSFVHLFLLHARTDTLTVYRFVYVSLSRFMCLCCALNFGTMCRLVVWICFHPLEFKPRFRLFRPRFGIIWCFENILFTILCHASRNQVLRCARVCV